MQIVGEYIAWKRPILNNREQHDLWIGETMKHASVVAKGKRSMKEILDTWGYMQSKIGDNWKLITTNKYITQEI